MDDLLLMWDVLQSGSVGDVVRLLAAVAAGVLLARSVLVLLRHRLGFAISEVAGSVLVAFWLLDVYLRGPVVSATGVWETAREGFAASGGGVGGLLSASWDVLGVLWSAPVTLLFG